MMLYKFRCDVINASQADVDQWLANHAYGPHYTFDLRDKERIFGGPCIQVSLTDERDRLALREAFDVRKMTFV